MTTSADPQKIDPEAAAEKQVKLTQRVGETLTRESHDAEIPRWRRWLKHHARA